jgi:hypothetical protein
VGAAGSSGTPTLAATWTFPALIATGPSTSTFPSYASHLLGKQITEPFPTDLACATVANSGAADGVVHLSVSLATYATSAALDVTVPAQSTKKTCLTPTFAKAALYALTAPDSATLMATAKDSGGADVGSSSKTIAVAPVDNIPWSANGIDAKTLKDMAAVYVEPNALDVDKLQKLAQQYSVFGTSPAWGDGSSPYQRSPYSRSSVISPGASVAIAFAVETTEATNPFTTWLIQAVDCSLCTDPSVDVRLYTAAQYNAAVAGTSTATTASWSSQGANAIDTRVLGTAGQYVVVFSNPESNFVDRTVTWSRSVTMQDVLRDVLLATFSALRAAGVTYSSVTSTFFAGWQHVRRVTTSLETLSANCIDGTFVFASVAEFLGLQPVLLLRSDHAYVGLRSGFKGSSVVWPIETTLVGSSATPAQAFDTAITNLVNDRANDPTHQEVDIVTLRSRGVTPLVQQ